MDQTVTISFDYLHKLWYGEAELARAATCSMMDGGIRYWDRFIEKVHERYIFSFRTSEPLSECEHALLMATQPMQTLFDAHLSAWLKAMRRRKRLAEDTTKGNIEIYNAPFFDRSAGADVYVPGSGVITWYGETQAFAVFNPATPMGQYLAVEELVDASLETLQIQDAGWWWS